MKLLILGLLSIGVSWADPSPSPTLPFSSELFYLITQDRQIDNIVVSPVSIRTCLALAYIGANGTTGDELKRGLQLTSNNKQEVSEEFSHLFEKTAALVLANRVYIDAQFQTLPTFDELASIYFNSAVESVDFKNDAEVADNINSWVSKETNNKIQRLVSKDNFDESTLAVLVNVIYFNAKWAKPFLETSTTTQEFFVSATEIVPVDMMSQLSQFRYGVLDDLHATAVELPYEGTNLNMLVILPNSIDGWSDLQAKLQSVDVTTISETLKEESVQVELPKFKIEFGISLQYVLEKMGMSTMFTSFADFSELLNTEQKLKVSEVKHKAFIEVTEVGTEAGAATAVFSTRNMVISQDNAYKFIVNHPFNFYILDAQNVHFAGTIKSFDKLIK